MIPQEREDAGSTEWDRFGRTEYVRLAMEEEGDEVTDADGGPDVWAAQGFDMT
jgi:serine/threonine-protein phosphatase 2A regulatory subunit B''